MTTPYIDFAFEDLFYAVVFVHGPHSTDMSLTGADGNALENSTLYSLPAGTYDLQLSYDGAQSAFIQLQDSSGDWRKLSQVDAGSNRRNRRGQLEQVSLPKGGRFTTKTSPPQPDGAAGVATVRVIRTPSKN